MATKKQPPKWRALLHELIEEDEDLARLHWGRLMRIEEKIADFIEDIVLKEDN